MKNKLAIAISVFFVCISFFGYSQASPYIIGVESGMGISSTYPSANDNSVRVGFTMAVSGQYIFTDLLSIKTGLGYELKGSKGIVPLELNPVGEGKYYQNLHFLTIPVLAKATFGKEVNFFRNEIKFFANAGPCFGFLLKQNTKLVATEYSAEEKVNNTDSFKKLELGITLGGGIVYSVYKNMDITVELRDNLGLNNLYDAAQFDGSSIKTNSTNLIIGVAFGI